MWLVNVVLYDEQIDIWRYHAGNTGALYRLTEKLDYVIIS